MSALVIFESLFGGTRAVAHAVMDGLSEFMPVDVAEIGARSTRLPPRSVPGHVDLLVVGLPSRTLGAHHPSTAVRAVPGTRSGVICTHASIREWLDLVRLPPHDLVVAAFDTVSRLDVPGSAARAAQRILERRGGIQAVPVRSFETIGMTEGLAEGELDAARDWGRDLGSHVTISW